jgi:hypothetical protein
MTRRTERLVKGTAATRAGLQKKKSFGRTCHLCNATSKDRLKKKKENGGVAPFEWRSWRDRDFCRFCRFTCSLCDDAVRAIPVFVEVLGKLYPLKLIFMKNGNVLYVYSACGLVSHGAKVFVDRGVGVIGLAYVLRARIKNAGYMNVSVLPVGALVPSDTGYCSTGTNGSGRVE